ncbi:response regulator transcription factor [Mycobacterium manitobense]|uniref:Response regulator transcription factor n=1 Tax=[Mycobacterium] manitobense TaxID=190147 RepID=A0A9X2YRA2_9MYCO|nr:response regulator transcription factor [[Mycobacterium] manitobense]MCV7171936.1 response regulator transcription factor [[Mycobacterium] manitobense]
MDDYSTRGTATIDPSSPNETTGNNPASTGPAYAVNAFRVSADYGPRASGNHRINIAGRRESPRWDEQWHGADRTKPSAPRDPRLLLRDARILIVDDCTMFREYLADVISAHGATFTGVAWDVPSLLSAFEDILPRVILINMATRSSAVLLRQALQMGSDVRVVAIGVSEHDESEIVACAEAGVAGYHLRSDSLEELLVLVQLVAEGESLCSPRVTAILLRRLNALASQRPVREKEPVLTLREAQILKMLELGLSNRDIAEQLCIAVHTVKNHVHSLLNKLEVSTRAQAAALSRTIRYGESDQRN